MFPFFTANKADNNKKEIHSKLRTYHLLKLTNKVIINLKFRKCNNLLKPLIKESTKYIKLNQFINYCTHNKNEINVSPKIKLKAKRSSWSWKTEIWKTISWQNFTVTGNFWRECCLNSIKNFKWVSFHMLYKLISSEFWTLSYPI